VRSFALLAWPWFTNQKERGKSPSGDTGRPFCSGEQRSIWTEILGHLEPCAVSEPLAGQYFCYIWDSTQDRYDLKTMKPTYLLLTSTALVLSGLAQLNPLAAGAPKPSAASLKTEVQKIEVLAEQIAGANTNDQKARSWLALNREAKKFADQMNVAFPETTAKGDKIFPEEAQRIAEKATSYGVRIDFCEMGGNWGADNQGYLKYLELWPNGPEADEATWMGPMGNGSFCGDFEGSIEELQETIALHKRFLRQFPNSRFASQAKQELSQSEEQLAKALRSSNHQ